MPRRDDLGVEGYDSGYDSLASLEAAAPYPPDPRGLAVPCPPTQYDAPRVLVCHDTSGRPPSTTGERRYTFEHYHRGVTDFVHFSHRRVTIPPPDQIIAAHRNGARCLGVLIFEGDGGATDCLDLGVKPSISPSATEPATSLIKLRTGPRGSPFDQVDLRIVDRLVELCLAKGFDGYLLNFEVALGIREPSSSEDEEPKRRFAREHASAVIGALRTFSLFNPPASPFDHRTAWVECLRNAIGKRIPNGTVCWYDSVTTMGDLRWQCRLTPLNAPFFLAAHSIFLDYHWRPDALVDLPHLARLLDQAGRTAIVGGSESERVGHRAADVFVGIDVYGRGMVGGGGFDTSIALAAIPKELSIAIFAPAWTRDELSRPREEDWTTWEADDEYFWQGGERAPPSLERERQRRDEEDEKRRREMGDLPIVRPAPPFRPLAGFLPAKMRPPSESFFTSFARGGSDGPFRVAGENALGGPWTDIGVTTPPADRITSKLRGVKLTTRDSWLAGHSLEVDPAQLETRWLPLCTVNLPLKTGQAYRGTIHLSTENPLPNLLLELTDAEGRTSSRAVKATGITADVRVEGGVMTKIRWRTATYDFRESTERIIGRITSLGVHIDPNAKSALVIGSLALVEADKGWSRFIEQPSVERTEAGEYVVSWRVEPTPLWCAIDVEDVGCLGTTLHPERFVVPSSVKLVEPLRWRVRAIGGDGTVLTSTWVASSQ